MCGAAWRPARNGPQLRLLQHQSSKPTSPSDLDAKVQIHHLIDLLSPSSSPVACHPHLQPRPQLHHLAASLCCSLVACYCYCLHCRLLSRPCQLPTVLPPTCCCQVYYEGEVGFAWVMAGVGCRLLGCFGCHLHCYSDCYLGCLLLVNAMLSLWRTIQLVGCCRLATWLLGKANWMLKVDTIYKLGHMWSEGSIRGRHCSDHLSNPLIKQLLPPRPLYPPDHPDGYSTSITPTIDFSGDPVSSHTHHQ